MATNDNFKDFLESGIDYKNRIISFGCNEDEDGEINWLTVETACRAITLMAIDHPKTPISLHMNSIGGDTYQMLRLYDCIQECPCQIQFYGSGQVMSSAVWIMCGCDERYLTPGTNLMIHNGSITLGEVTTTDFKIEYERDRRMNQQMLQILVNNSRMPVQFWEEILKRDYFFTPEEAILLGIADEIIEPKKRGNLRKMRQYKLSQPVNKKQLNKVVKQAFERVKAPGTQSLKIEIHIPQEEFDDSLSVETIDPSKQIQSSNIHSDVDASNDDQSQNDFEI
jgi:ATP-dependent protease ClpP protease subunit